MSSASEPHANTTPAPPPGPGRRVRPTAAPPSEPRLLAALATELGGEIERRWRGYYPERAACATPAIVMQTRQCGFSALYKVDLRFEDPPATEQLMVKIRREGRFGPFLLAELSARTVSASRLEYDEHVRAYQFFRARSRELSVVRPLDYLPDYNAILVNYASGRPLSTIAQDPGNDGVQALGRCGQWWRLFHHELHGARDRPWDAKVIDGYVERRLKRLKKVGVPEDTLRKVQDEVRDSTRRITPAPVPVSLIHGDCKLRHVWGTSEGIEVLDFGNTKTGDSWIDPAALVVELSLYSLWTTRLDSEPHVDHMRSLIRAYFDGPPPPAFALFVVDCLLKKWHRRLRDWGAGSGLRRVRQTLATVGLEKGVDRLYLDRWFTTQVRAWLAVAEGQPPAWLRPATS